MKKLLTALLLITCLFTRAQVPVNDNCNTATNLGTLPTPAACPSGIGSTVTVVGTNLNATAPSPYTTLLGCQTGGNQPGPALDVWYSFVASGNQVNINITPGAAPFLANPAITLWTGTCGSLIGFNCDNNGTAGGANSVLFQPTTPGQTYYIQVSGVNAVSAGNFNLAINASNDCNNCLQSANLTVSPLPVNGTYAPGTTVNFCYNITSFTQVSDNWLHGVIPTFGSGWNLASIVPVPAASCSGSGTWSWYNSWNGSIAATAGPWGPGFAYDYTSSPGNPGNNFGDNCSAPNWNFCWSITTKPICTPGNTNLNVSINTTGDGETGSWSSVACTGDPNYQFAAVMSCCSTSATSTSVTCFGGTNGTASAIPTGSAPFTYTWSSIPVQNTQVATNLPAGNYTVSVRDNNGCVSTATVSITQPTQIVANTTTINSTCGQSNGSATVTAVGGVGPYTYLWSNGQTTQSINTLSVGSYSVVVTGVGGCTATANANITTTGSITTTSTFTNINCFGVNGSASTTPTGGSTYTYLWSNGQTTQTITGLLAGVYTVTVTSAGCTTTSSVTIIQPNQILSTMSMTATTCGLANGSASTTPTGTGPYTYLWSNGATTQTITGLLSGVYTVTISSLGACTTTNSVTVLNTGSPSVTIPTSTNVSCFVGSDGAATSTVSGGVGPYTYLWSNGQTTPTAINLVVGPYTLTVTGSNGCSSSASVSITQPAQLLASITTTAVSCFGGTNGSAMVTPTGGTGTYTYTWNSLPIQTTQTANSLPLGIYTCTVTDANGCQVSTSANINQPTQLSIVLTTTNVSCFGGTNGVISTSVTGGTGLYTYAINLGPNQLSPIFGSLSIGTYTIKVTDANGCIKTETTTITQPTQIVATATPTNVTCFNACDGKINANIVGGTAPYNLLWSNGSTSNPVTGLCVGSYSVTITDANGCIKTTTSVITQPTQLISNPTASSNTICIGQQSIINSNLFGGTAPYTYTWSTGSTITTTTVSPITTTTYTLNESDANGCSLTKTITIVVNPALNVNATSPSTICSGGTSTITAIGSGGNGGPYAYTWSGLGSGQSIAVSPTITTTYTVTLSDGCSPSVTNTVTVNVTPLPIVSYTTTILSGCDPLVVTFNNTTPGVTGCNWQLGSTSLGCNPTYTFSAGTYSLNLTVSVNGCQATSPMVNVNVYAIPTASFTATPMVTDINNNDIQFTNLSTPGLSSWTFGDGGTSTMTNPSYVYNNIGQYDVQLIITTVDGCQAATGGIIYIKDYYTFWVPNAFTPDGNGNNELFFPVIMGYKSYTMMIYNRWGEQIFYGVDMKWDGTVKGKIVQQDVYVWKISVVDFEGKQHQYIGHVTLLN